MDEVERLDIAQQSTLVLHLFGQFILDAGQTVLCLPFPLLDAFPDRCHFAGQCDALLHIQFFGRFLIVGQRLPGLILLHQCLEVLDMNLDVIIVDVQSDFTRLDDIIIGTGQVQIIDLVMDDLQI